MSEATKHIFLHFLHFKAGFPLTNDFHAARPFPLSLYFRLKSCGLESGEICQWKTGLNKKTVTLILSLLFQTLKNMCNAVQAVY